MMVHFIELCFIDVLKASSDMIQQRVGQSEKCKSTLCSVIYCVQSFISAHQATEEPVYNRDPLPRALRGLHFGMLPAILMLL